MKKLHHLVLGLLLSTMVWSCQSESVSPQSGPKDILGTYIPVPRPSVQCGPSIFSSMKAGTLNLGTVEIFNNSSDLYVYMDLNTHKYLEEIKVFRGNAANLPLNDDGMVTYNQFPIQNSLSAPLNDYSFTLPLAGFPACNDLVIWARITTRGTLGNVVATHYAWLMGSPIGNGYKVNYCNGLCPTGSNDGSNAN